MTLNDLERRNGVILRCFGKFGYLPGALRKIINIIIIRTFVTRAVSANTLNLRRRQSLGEEDEV